MPFTTAREFRGYRSNFLRESHATEVEDLKSNGIEPYSHEEMCSTILKIRQDLIVTYLMVSEAEEHLREIKSYARTIRDLLFTLVLLPFVIVYLVFHHGF